MSIEYPLHAAVVDNNLEEVNRLLEQDTEQVNTPDQNGDTPLNLAVQNKYYGVACRLVEHGATIAPALLTESDLHHAARYNEVEQARFYILAGMDVNATDTDGNTPLHIACLDDDIYDNPQNAHDMQSDGWKTEVVALLLQHKADCWCWNKEGISPLWYALFSKNFVSVKLLVEHGAELWCWLLHGACRYHDEDIVEFLLSQGCDANGRYDPDDPDQPETDRYTALHTLCQHSDDEDWRGTSIAKILLTRGADVNARDEKGKTPLFYALCDGCVGLWQVLLEHRGSGINVADVVNIQDYDGNTPLHLLFMQKKMRYREQALEWLSPLADMNIKNKAGQTPLQLVFSRIKEPNAQECVRALFEYGQQFDIDFRLADGTTPLIWAAEKMRDKRLTWLMLKKGSPIDADEKQRVQKMFATFDPDELFYTQNGFYPKRPAAPDYDVNEIEESEDEDSEDGGEDGEDW